MQVVIYRLAQIISLRQRNNPDSGHIAIFAYLAPPPNACRQAGRHQTRHRRVDVTSERTNHNVRRAKVVSQDKVSFSHILMADKVSSLFLRIRYSAWGPFLISKRRFFDVVSLKSSSECEGAISQSASPWR